MSHALLSPSSSHRWLACTPSARLAELYEDKTSDAAQEGTLAHATCEALLRKEKLPEGLNTVIAPQEDAQPQATTKVAEVEEVEQPQATTKVAEVEEVEQPQATTDVAEVEQPQPTTTSTLDNWEPSEEDNRRQAITDQLKAIIDDKERDGFDPEWFAVASELMLEGDDKQKLREQLSDFATDLATTAKNPKGIVRLIQHYTGGKKGITNIPEQSLMPFYYGISYFFNHPMTYEFYSEGKDTVKTARIWEQAQAQAKKGGNQ